ncbi:hypothetical protein HN51_028917, partial [Arachis hypogaea]
LGPSDFFVSLPQNGGSEFIDHHFILPAKNSDPATFIPIPKMSTRWVRFLILEFLYGCLTNRTKAKREFFSLILNLLHTFLFSLHHILTQLCYATPPPRLCYDDRLRSSATSQRRRSSPTSHHRLTVLFCFFVRRCFLVFRDSFNLLLVPPMLHPSLLDSLSFITIEVALKSGMEVRNNGVEFERGISSCFWKFEIS